MIEPNDRFDGSSKTNWDRNYRYSPGSGEGDKEDFKYKKDKRERKRDSGDDEERKEKRYEKEGEYRRKKRRSRSSSNRSSSSSSSRSSSGSSNSSSSRHRRSKTRSKSRDYRGNQDNYQDRTANQGWYSQQGFQPTDQSMAYQYADGSYPQNYNTQNFRGGYNPYQGYEQSGYYQGQNFQTPMTHEYSMGGPAIQGASWENNVMYPDVSQPPPMAGTSAASTEQNRTDQKTEDAKKEAVEQELIQQKLTMAKQREEYIRKKISLTRELNRLKDQKRELVEENSKGNERILRENSKLRSEIQTKLKSIDSVIEMLTGIIGDKANLADVFSDVLKKEKKGDKRKRSESPQPVKHKDLEKMRSISPENSEVGKKCNLVHYDPELHWCSECNVFPRTVIDYLNHLHSEEHKLKSKMKLEEMPWHVDHPREPSPPFIKDAPCKRTPIRGVQFLVPSSAWYCSLCKEWLGDLICATKHLKTSVHAKKYGEFTSQNPHWEIDWLTERTRSYERGSDDKKPKEEEEPSKSLGDQLLAMLAQNKLPDHKNDNSSQESSDDSDDAKHHKDKKKKKKSKKKKNKSPKSKRKSPKFDLYDNMEGDLKDKNTIESYYNNDFQVPNESFDLRPKDTKRQFKARNGSEDDSEYKFVDSDSENAKNQRNNKIDPEQIKRPFQDTKIILNDVLPFEYTEVPMIRKKVEEKSPIRVQQVQQESEEESQDRFYEAKKSPDLKYSDLKYKQYKKKDSKRDRYESKSYKKDRRDRDRSRDRDMDRRDRDRDRDRDGRRRKREKEPRRPPPPMRNLDKRRRKEEEDNVETTFEKRTSESAAKKKEVKKTSFTIAPKSKLPFIGRMPILKKKAEPPKEEPEEKKEDVPLTAKELKKLRTQEHFKAGIMKIQEKQQDKAQKAFEMLYQLTGHVPLPLQQAMEKGYREYEKMYGPALPASLIVKEPQLIQPLQMPLLPAMPVLPMVQPSDTIVGKEVLFKAKGDDNVEQDMEIDEEQLQLQQQQLLQLQQQLPNRDELHKDFKDALDLLFPENGKPRPRPPPKIEIKAPELPPGTVPYDVAVMAGNMGYDISMYTEQGQQQQQYQTMLYYMQQQAAAYMAQMGYDSTTQTYTGDSSYAQSGESSSAPAMEGIPSKQDEPLEMNMTKPTQTVEVEKKKNPPSQRKRRHMKKLAMKKAQEEGAAEDAEKEDNQEKDENEETIEDEEEEHVEEPEKEPTEEKQEPEPEIQEEQEPEQVQEDKSFQPVEMSELALLGIEEGDITAQNYFG